MCLNIFICLPSLETDEADFLKDPKLERLSLAPLSLLPTTLLLNNPEGEFTKGINNKKMKFKFI